ncbi:MAG: Gfo/Idh/MocA family oxidoreductase [Armatimonadota bacterium]|nr:Gfo/Idh/MocA family oxidoreductase [Armatimonadota bacterium]
MSKKISRRKFIKSAAVGGFGFVLLKNSRMAFGFEANEKLNIAIIGCGGKGRSNLGSVAGENIVALCDVDDNTTAAAAEKFPQAKLFADFRKMLDKMHNEIDAVVVSTPDHTHAPAAVMAMKMGKHVYCEKPLTHSIYEARVMRDTARKYKVATQMGNQGTAGDGFRESVEAVRAGAIGQVHEVYVWSNRPIWPQGIDRPVETPPVPSNLHWDLWLGSAPKRPYNEAYQPFKWRGWVDFGTGALGDMGCHTLNMPFMALDLRNPMSVEAEVFEMTAEAYPKKSIITYIFPQRGNLRTLRLKWYDGGLMPSDSILYGKKLSGSGCALIGDKGHMHVTDDYGSRYELLPKDEFTSFQPPAPTLPRSSGHHQEWIEACKGGAPAMSNFDYASALTETILLGNLAIVTGEPINWDAENMRAINCPKADCHINRPYRKGWSL